MSETKRTAKTIKSLGGDTVVLGTGVEVRLKPVSAFSLDMVRQTVKDPKPPTYERDGIVEANIGDPDYLENVKKALDERNRAVMEALLVLGVELVDGVPPVDTWLKQVRYLNKRYDAKIGDGYDLEDPDDQDLLYKLVVAVGPNDWKTIGLGCGTMSEEDIQMEMDNFRGDEERSPDPSTPAG